MHDALGHLGHDHDFACIGSSRDALPPAPVPGVRLDLDGIAKGYAADQLVERAAALVRGSGEAHHLIDPRSGRSVDEGLAWVSVIARHAAQAEVLTKAGFLAGPDVGRVLLEELGVAGVLVRDENVFIEVGNLRELTA